MMNNFWHCLALLFLCLQAEGLSAQERTLWKTPQSLDDKNSEITFEVDSTWHTVHGNTSKISGRVWLSDTSDIMSVNTELHLPVKFFDTDSTRRDASMREVMAEDRFPEVVIRTTAIEGACTPEEIEKISCNGTLTGTLNIRGVSKPVRLPYKITLKNGKYEVSGQYTLQWADFGVEDPSILIAKLQQDVTVSYRYNLDVVRLSAARPQ